MFFLGVLQDRRDTKTVKMRAIPSEQRKGVERWFAPVGTDPEAGAPEGIGFDGFNGFGGQHQYALRRGFVGGEGAQDFRRGGEFGASGDPQETVITVPDQK